MELFWAILLCFLIAVLVAVGEVYLGMDKQKARAGVFVARMKEYLDNWVSLTVALIDTPGTDPESALEVRALADSYFSSKKYRERMKKIPLVNAMAAQTAQLSENRAYDAETNRLLKERLDAEISLEPLRKEYNKCVKKLNGRLDKPIPSAVGKLLSMRRLEEFRELSSDA